MINRRAALCFLPWLLAAAFLAVQTATFAHELKHDLKLHDDPSCVLHLYTKHAGHAVGDATPAFVALPEAHAAARVTCDAGGEPQLGYRTRAPPASSSRSI